jgi:pentatricopeptide repeat protein
MGLENDVGIGSVLVELYCKNGFLETAHQVFEKLEVRSVVTWNALISGYAQLGDCENVFTTFKAMEGEGKQANQVTFQNLLNVCSHAGLVGEVQMCVKCMSTQYGMKLDLEHYTCIIDALCRAGQVNLAITMIKDLPFSPDQVVWHSILGGCSKWGELELGRHAFEYAILLDEKDVGAYISMHNLYA